MKKKTEKRRTSKEAPIDQLASRKADDFQKLVIGKNEYYDEVSTYDDFLETLIELKKQEDKKPT